ncbi:sensor histidine kinase [Gorillibacterium sp. sgz5001074]|uniref:sensor histidine kinase n=1 Tax=Gorillibacterium sp. sgz5001074 TaxID=3446695 RepID=UPI003F66D388
MGSIRSKLNRILYRYTIRKKLLICSMLLTLTLASTFYWLSEAFVNRLVVQEKAAQQLNELKQNATYFKSLFADMDATTNKLVGEDTVQAAVSIPYRRDNFIQIGELVQTLTTEINDTFLYHDYIDRIIVLGKNDLVYMYAFDVGGKYAGTDFRFDDWLHASPVYPRNMQEGVPFYSQVIGAIADDTGDQQVLRDLIEGKIAYFRSIRLENDIIGTLIVTFNTAQFAKEVFYGLDPDESLMMMTNRQVPIWSSSPGRMDVDSLTAPFLHLEDVSYRVAQINGQPSLLTHYPLSSYPFEFVSEIPKAAILKHDTRPNSAIVVFALVSLIFVVLLSFWFAGTIVEPLHELTQKLTEGFAGLQSRSSVEPRIVLPKYSVRSKLIAYFVLTTFLPNLLFVLLLTYVHYGHYQSKVMQFTESTIQQLKRNIDYSLKSYDTLTRQLIYLPDIQQLMRKSESGGVKSDDMIVLELQFGNIKQRKREFMSMELYNRSGERIYTGIYSDNVPIARTNPHIFERLDHSSGELLFIGSYRNLYRSPVLTFARKVSNSSASSLGDRLGYLIVNIEQDMLNNIFRTLRIGDSGYFFLIDANETILAHDNDDLTSHVLDMADPVTAEMMRNPSGSYAKNIGSKRYMVFFDTASYFGVKMAGIVPSAELKKKVYMLIWFGAAFFALFGMMIIVAATLISRTIINPLHKLQSLMQDVHDGNLEVQMNYKGKDEIAILAHYFNSMIKQLNELITEVYQSKIREQELMFLEKEAQLRALQQQINPHFLYNTLESIKWMAFRKGSEEIVEMTTALGQFFRGSITKSAGLILMEEELSHLKHYLDIQKIRAKSRFDIIWDVAEALHACLTVKLILQPIVENAIIHGLDQMEADGLLLIRGYMDGDHMYIDILDNGAGMAEEQWLELKRIVEGSQGNGHFGIGLVNVFRRLNLYFNDRYAWRIDSRPGRGTLVQLRLPVLTLDDPKNRQGELP